MSFKITRNQNLDTSFQEINLNDNPTVQPHTIEKSNTLSNTVDVDKNHRSFGKALTVVGGLIAGAVGLTVTLPFTLIGAALCGLSLGIGLAKVLHEDKKSGKSIGLKNINVFGKALDNAMNKVSQDKHLARLAFAGCILAAPIFVSFVAFSSVLHGADASKKELNELFENVTSKETKEDVEIKKQVDDINKIWEEE